MVSFKACLFIHEGLTMRWWSLACVVRSLARESGRLGVKKTSAPQPLHWILCLHSWVGGNGDSVCSGRWRRTIKNSVALFFLLSKVSVWIKLECQRMNHVCEQVVVLCGYGVCMNTLFLWRVVRLFDCLWVLLADWLLKDYPWKSKQTQHG